MKKTSKILSENELNDLIDLRRKIHSFPEISGEEVETAKRLSDYIEKFKPTEIIKNIGGNGIAAVFEFGNGPTVLVRSELDALPIQEINSFEYKSTVEGKSHKCGHDGHMVMLAGLANLLSKRPWEKGRVVLLFQPAEETGEGAIKVLQDEKFVRIEPDYVMALHNLPGFESTSVVCKNDSFTASVKSMII